MRCILYARVSLEEQAEQFGLAAQLRALREYAKAKGYESVEEFVDAGYSGADDDRPALAKVRELMRAGAVDVVVAYDNDRLSRDLGFLLAVMKDFDRYGIRLEFVNSKVAETEEDKMFLGMKGVFAAYERTIIRDRTLRGRREKAKQGFIVGGRVPFGYKYLGKAEGERGKLIVDPERAPVVQQIYQWATEGVSIRSIASRLNEAGIPSMFVGKWGKSSVARLLQNETYIGTAHYNRRKRTEPRELTQAHKARHNKKTLLKERPASEWISIATPAIIAPSTFQQVAVTLQRNKVVLLGRKSRRYLLRGLLWCHCGLRMNGDPNHGCPCYRCTGRDKNRPEWNGCQQRASGQKLDTTVWEAVAEKFRSARALRGIIEKHREKFDKPEVNRDQLSAKIGQLKLRESRGVRALMDLDGEHQGMVRAELRKVADERRRLQAQLAEDSVVKQSLTTDWIGRICREFAARFEDMDTEQRQGFLRQVVERITLKGQDVAILCSFAGLCPQRIDIVPTTQQRVSFTIETRWAA